MRDLKFTVINTENLIPLGFLPLFVLSVVHPWGFALSIGICILFLAVLYGIRHVDILLMLVLYAPIIKASPLNPIPEWLDLTVIFYAAFLLLTGVLFLFRKVHLPSLGMADLLLLFYLVLVIIGFFRAPYEVTEYSTFKLIRFSILSVPFFFFPKLLTKDDLLHLARLTAVVGGVICLALFLVFPTAIDIKDFGNSYLTMAKLAGICLLFSAVSMVRERHILWKLLYATTMLISLLLVFKTNSRAGILFAPFILVVYFIFVFRRQRLLALFALLVIVMATIITYQLYPDFFTRFFLIFKSHKGSSINLRFTLYEVSIRLLHHRWFDGIGLGGFALYHYLEYPHNFILESFVEHGLAGGITILLWISYLTKHGFQLLKEKIMESELAGYILSFGYLFLFYMTSFGLESMRLLLFFAGCVVTVCARSMLTEEPVSDS